MGRPGVRHEGVGGARGEGEQEALESSAESEVGDVEVRVAPGPSLVSGVLGGAKKDGTRLPISWPGDTGCRRGSKLL